VTSSLRPGRVGVGARSVRTVYFCRLSGMPPNRAIKGFRPSPRSILASRHLRGPCGVSMVVIYLRDILTTVEWYLPARVLSNEVCITQWSRVKRPMSTAIG
jgi:hypothetical protein